MFDWCKLTCEAENQKKPFSKHQQETLLGDFSILFICQATDRATLCVDCSGL